MAQTNSVDTALIERPVTSPAVTISAEQKTLIKNTLAKDATDAELQLFFYDCTRRGVHPLDRLIHFTKRGGKYTPITSIDFMRSRAHETGACAGISEAEFTGDAKKPGFAARVVVKRLVGGQFAEFPATARWEEYKPEQNAFMWERMPHTMLGKCAEALALRKAFPQQLQGLYAAEEMEQAGPVDVVVTEHSATVQQAAQSTAPPHVQAPPPSPGNVRQGSTRLISEPQRRRMFAKAKAAGWETDNYRALIQRMAGVERDNDVPVAKYDAIVSRIEQGPEALHG